MNRLPRPLLAFIALLLLHGCDDTDVFVSGSSGPVTSNASFPLAQSLADFIAGAHVYSYETSGSADGFAITGSGTITFGAAAGSTFEGQSALSQLLSIVGTLTSNGTTAPDSLAGQYYYTTNYDPLGSSAISGEIYCVADGNPSYPSVARVGDSATIATYICYEDSTKAVLLSEDIERYEVSADTTDTAIVDIITTSSSQNILQSTARYRYRISETGDLDWLSLTFIDNTTSPASTLTYTAR